MTKASEVNAIIIDKVIRLTVKNVPTPKNAIELIDTSSAIPIANRAIIK